MIRRRVCVFPQDIRILTGRSERSSRLLFKKLKAHYHKDEHQFITFSEFCDYTGIPLEEVEKQIGSRN